MLFTGQIHLIFVWHSLLFLNGKACVSLRRDLRGRFMRSRSQQCGCERKEGAKNKTKHKDDIKKQKSTMVDTHYVAWIKQDRVYMLCLLEITCIVFLFFHIFVRLIYPPSILPVASYYWAVVSVCPLGGTERNCAYYARIKHLFWPGITVKQLAKSWPCFNQVNLWVIPCPAPTKPRHYLH